MVFTLLHFRYGLQFNSDKPSCSGNEPPMTTSSARLSSLCGQDGLLQSRDTFSGSASVYVYIKNISGEFLHTMGRVIGIATNYSPWPPKGKTKPIFGASTGHSVMR